MQSQKLNNGHAADDSSILAAIASLLVGAAFLSLWFWLLPRWLRFDVNLTGVNAWSWAWSWAWRWLAAIPPALGFGAALRCVWNFGRVGHGTPAPMFPPKRLVVVGLYRYVRNPMYLGLAAGWIGLWIMFGHAIPQLIAGVAAAALGVHLFVVLYEEPTLRRKFGADYEAYCRNVRRWLPRFTPWELP